jgi:hypothetical protein
MNCRTFPAGAIHHADGFHHAGGTGDVDLPHALAIEDVRLLRVENKGEMDYRSRLGGAQ